ncbi:stage V sporulation protein AA [Anaerobacillus sp. MEB173]|uniref:stage V sporulation protein AA n=1 Tax=Anaerobacillus sp. MEB173 TaxID=3383345 RepID=UPI003F8E2218
MVYLRMRHRVEVKLDQDVTIGDIAQIVSANQIREEIGKIMIHHVTKNDKNLVVIDVMKVILEIRKQMPDIEVQTIGGSQTILQVYYPKKTFTPVYFISVWLLLFVGAGLAIMNFHEDVSMQKVHQKIFEIVTGEENSKPLLFQIPYSIGLGVGMILFFNHLFRKRINEEPSPLEVEMFNYQQDLDQYVIMNENSESETKLNGN